MNSCVRVCVRCPGWRGGGGYLIHGIYKYVFWGFNPLPVWDGAVLTVSSRWFVLQNLTY